MIKMKINIMWFRGLKEQTNKFAQIWSDLLA